MMHSPFSYMARTFSIIWSLLVSRETSSMSSSTKRVSILLIVIVFTATFIANDLFGHGGRFKRPIPKGGDPNQQDPSQTSAADKRGYSFPGGGPQVLFSESRWEFWWDFNADDLIGLQPALMKLSPKAGAVVDFPYEKPTKKDKQEKLVRYFLNLLKKEKSPEIREAAVLSLARTRDPNVIPYIEAAYDDKDEKVRTMAVIALGVSQNQQAGPILESISNNKDTSTEIRSFAIVAMGLLGGDSALKAFKRWLSPQVFKKLDRITQQTVAFGAGITEDSTLCPLIRTALIDNFSDDRITISYLILSLGRLGDRAANANIIKHLSNRDAQIRRSAAVALGSAASPSDKDVIEALINSAKNDADNMLKNFCFIALGKIGGETAEKFLIKELDNVTRDHLPFVGLAIGLTGQKSFGDKMLRKFLEVKDINTKSALALTLGMLKNENALGELRKIVDGGSDPIYKGYCALALGMLKDNKSVERLIDLYFSQHDVELHRFVAIALGLIGDRSITVKMYNCLKDSPDTIRHSSAYNLGLIGDKRAIDPLKTVVENKSETNLFRKYAILGLGHIADDSEVPVVSRITKNCNYTILDNFLYELYNIN